MNYPKRFFEINLRFAQRIAEVTGQSFESTLLHYTNFYIRFGLGRDFAATNSAWQTYVEGLPQVEDAAEWTYRFYLKRQEQVAPNSHDSLFGCFSYALMDGNRIRLHFHNNESSEHSPLSQDRMGQRLVELRRMFAHLKQAVSAPTTVIGASWLYNLDTYRRLFPPTYLATAQVSHNNFPYLPLWGQFIDHRGRVKENLVARFLECLDKQHRLENIEQCFPFQVLHLESSIPEFYQFYDL